MHLPLPLTRDVVLIGGGHTHALVLRKWGMAPLPGARLTLINPAPTAPYTGMLPGHVAGHYPREALDIDMVTLARHAGARLILGAVSAIDRSTRRITVPGRAPIRYDIASIDIGITSAMPELPGFAEHAVPAKPLGPFAGAWEAFLDAARARTLPANVAVIGGGVGGVELSLAMAERMRRAGLSEYRITVLEAGPVALNGIGEGARRALLAHMARLGVTLRTDAHPAQIHADHIVLADGDTLPAGFVTGAAGARPHGWLADTDLDLEDGFIRVDECLRSSDPAIYAVGDCAHLSHAPRPKAGVFAVREAPKLAHNLRADLTGGQRKPFHPQRDYLKLISTGGKGAVADKFGLTFDGAYLWRLKDRIDRKFMDQFTHLPRMQPPALPREVAHGLRDLLGDTPLCGGCGAKVAQADLKTALATLPTHTHPDVLQGAGDDAAVLRHGAGAQVITTDHIRAFVEDPWTFAKIATVHALGDVWAMGAAPQAVLVSATLPRMTGPMQADMLAELLTATQQVVEDAGASIVGGHSSVGAEFSLGVTVTGLLEGQATRQSGARPGDVLILTKPIGSGTLLAAEMRGQARGRDVVDAYASMMRPLARDAACLAPVAHAMTDVTGFGLAGHLMTMLEQSGAAATLALDAVPVLPGAADCAAAGIRSSLFPANEMVRHRMTLPDHPAVPLLFDPQTAGGLLAAVPADHAEAVLSELASQEVPAARIGEVTEGTPWIEVI
ncbi:selenide,water dikinase [Rubricella aquisinus]|uniref:Selenide,water dikinase n=1 Tax=Rubricella aquisinus TaxID=2028108 RepID=A0A840X1Z5_9RHOB|nr:selenide, water dikinase SelD [Rubricella aquisinus]MBB5516814.1 selenide,water dikinase [Rubricella aquisinus]